MPRITRNKQFVDSTRLVEFCDHNDMQRNALGQTLGLGPSTVSSYISKGKMPKTVGLALEALERRQGRAKANGSFVLVHVPTGQAETLGKVVKAFGGRAFNIPAELEGD